MAQPAAVLSVLVNANTKGATTGLMRLNTRLAATDAKTQTMTSSMKQFGKTAALVGGAAGVGALAAGAKKAFGEFREAEKVTKQTEAVLKSTGNAAKVTAREIENLAEKISLKSGIDDEAIQKGENLLLTFGKIRNETGKGNKIFNEATQVITDMSVALDQDLKSSAIQVGKALQDPEKGITALKRVGVNFTETQKDMITGWLEHGKVLKAQKFILRELTTEFGGSAAAQADNADKLRVAWDNLFERIGKAFGPSVEKAMGEMATFIRQMETGRGKGGSFADSLREIADAFRDMRPVISAIGKAIGVVQKLFDTFGTFARNMAKATVRLWTDVWDRPLKAAGDFFAAMLRGFAKVFEAASHLPVIGKTFKGLTDRANEMADQVDRSGEKTKQLGYELKKLPKAKRINIKIDASVGAIKYGGFNPLTGRPQDAPAAGGPGSVLDQIGGATAKKVDGKRLLNSIGPVLGQPGAMKGGLSTIQKISLAMGLSGGLGSGQGYRPGDPGWHGRGRALDNSGPADVMMAFAHRMFSQFGSRLKELIYTPMGTGIKNGKPVNIESFYGPAVAADHYDHVHVAMQKGGVVQGLYRGGAVAHFNKWAGPRSHLHMGSQRELNRWANNHPASALRFYGWYSKHLRSNHSGTPVETHPAQRGGPIGGSGTGDTVPAMLEPGEFVMNRKATARMGPLLEAINKDIPRFASGGMVRAATAGRNAGFKGNALQYLLAIGGAESGNYTDMTGDMSLGGSYGPWMIHHPSHPEYNTSRLQSDWTYAAGAAYKISGGGTNWNPWTMFRNGGYRKYMGQAASVISASKGKGPAAVKRMANIVGKNGKNLTLKGKQATKSHTPYGGLGRGGILEAFITAQSDRLNMASALAALTEDTADDIAVARDAVHTWETWLGVAQLNKLPAGITTTATNLKSARDTLADLLAPVASESSNNDLERANLLQTLLSQANLRTAVSQAQYGALRYGGQFADGGVVPGAIGSPRVIVAHGGETVSPVGAGGVQVIVNGDISNVPRGKKAIEVRDIRGHHRPLPGRGGG